MIAFHHLTDFKQSANALKMDVFQIVSYKQGFRLQTIHLFPFDDSISLSKTAYGSVLYLDSNPSHPSSLPR